MISKEIAVSLKHGQILRHKTAIDSKKNPLCCRVSGKCQTRKTRPTEFKLPVKYGLLDSFYITEDNAKDWVFPD